MVVPLTLGVAVEVVKGGSTGVVGVTDALHPINARTMKIPENDKDVLFLISGLGGHRVRIDPLGGRLAHLDSRSRRPIFAHDFRLSLKCPPYCFNHRSFVAIVQSTPQLFSR